MLFAYASATVPKVTVIVRKAYGGAYLAMCAKAMGADRSCAWPGAEIAVMGAEGAVRVLARKEIDAAPDPAAELARRAAEYRQNFADPHVAAAPGRRRPASSRRARGAVNSGTAAKKHGQSRWDARRP
jgi:acetyl-CoA carboxylase carboxyltransferase component